MPLNPILWYRYTIIPFSGLERAGFGRLYSIIAFVTGTEINNYYDKSYYLQYDCHKENVAKLISCVDLRRRERRWRPLSRDENFDSVTVRVEDSAATVGL